LGNIRIYKSKKKPDNTGLSNEQEQLNNLKAESIKTIQIQEYILNLIILMQSSTINDNKI
jgi:hypothetical protein